MQLPGKIFFPLLVSIALFASGCGGGSGSSGGGGTTPPSTPSTANEWTWMSGSSTVRLMANGFYSQPGIYGTLGVASSSNVPGGRAGAISWTDSSGNLWLFGGNGYDSAGTLGILNDLWEFSPTAKTWTWVSGGNTGTADGSLHGTPGIYGTLGVASATNVPGERDAPVSWTDTSGDLWLFGGAGFDSTGALGNLNDLWEFSPTTKEWTWMGGSDTADAVGTYGTEGVPSASNVPGARYLSVSWTDKSGNFWLFSDGYANDLWEFNPTTKMWAWMSGSSDTMVVNPSAPGVYGTQGVASASNVPGARQEAVSWTDSSGNLWLFGGAGGEGVGGSLNDLWEFSPTTKEWTWVSGSSTINAFGVYGTMGTPSTSNTPGARNSAVSWTDSSGNLWLSGGLGLDSTGASGYLNDLWEFSPTAKTWAWMGGADTVQANNTPSASNQGQSGVYGTEGVPAAANVPGGRYSAASWVDGSGNLWLFGGNGHDSTGTLGDLNDLWRYQP
jgi:N-acetylneuraminic acid mutarotase